MKPFFCMYMHATRLRRFISFRHSPFFLFPSLLLSIIYANVKQAAKLRLQVYIALYLLIIFCLLALYALLLAARRSIKKVSQVIIIITHSSDQVKKTAVMNM